MYGNVSNYVLAESHELHTHNTQNEQWLLSKGTGVRLQNIATSTNNKIILVFPVIYTSPTLDITLATDVIAQNIDVGCKQVDKLM